MCLRINNNMERVKEKHTQPTDTTQEKGKLEVVVLYTNMWFVMWWHQEIRMQKERSLYSYGSTIDTIVVVLV